MEEISQVITIPWWGLIPIVIVTMIFFARMFVEGMGYMGHRMLKSYLERATKLKKATFDDAKGRYKVHDKELLYIFTGDDKAEGISLERN